MKFPSAVARYILSGLTVVEAMHLYIISLVWQLLGTTAHLMAAADGNFKERYYNHKTSFRNREKANDTTLSKNVWEVKDKRNAVLKVVNRKVCPRILKYHQEVLAMSL